MNIYEKYFGIRTRIVNAGVYNTDYGGNIMPPEVVKAMTDASKYWVDLRKLLKRSGEIIAESLGVEAAFVTSGSFAAVVLGTAACMTGKDVKKMTQLPDTKGLKDEVVIQRGQFLLPGYAHAFKVPGARLIEVGFSYPYLPSKREARFGTHVRTFEIRPEDIEAAITERTAAMAFIKSMLCVQVGTLPLREFAKIANKYDVPTIVDAANQLPPPSRIRMFFDKGADLVAISGGKDIRGPSDTGLLLGRKDLTEAAAMQANPNKGIGRGYKVSKEQIVGLTVAVQRYVNLKHETRLINIKKRCRWMMEQLKDIPHVKTEIIQQEAGTDFHFVRLTLEEESLGMKATEAYEMLKGGDPSILLRPLYHPVGILEINPGILPEDQDKLVIRRLENVLTQK